MAPPCGAKISPSFHISTHTTQPTHTHALFLMADPLGGHILKITVLPKTLINCGFVPFH